MKIVKITEPSPEKTTHLQVLKDVFAAFIDEHIVPKTTLTISDGENESVSYALLCKTDESSIVPEDKVYAFLFVHTPPKSDYVAAKIALHHCLPQNAKYQNEWDVEFHLYPRKTGFKRDYGNIYEDAVLLQYGSRSEGVLLGGPLSAYTTLIMVMLEEALFEKDVAHVEYCDHAPVRTRT